MKSISIHRIVSVVVFAGIAFLNFVGCEREELAIDGQTRVVEVTNPETGRTWMDRNLGASRAASSSTDEGAFGDLYQWGRTADGHQKRTSDTTSTISSSDAPNHGSFILTDQFSPGFFDWLNPPNDNLWQGVNGINNPCPPGFRLPTKEEWDEERFSWKSQDSDGAFASPLKLPLPGARSQFNGLINDAGSRGYYWASTPDGATARALFISSHGATRSGATRSTGLSVRCIQD